MIEDFKKGKYDGIIAWNPDRLARNMKDAGEIIDFLDKKVIKDLKFISFTFQNNTSGKMLLGISFVLSKQYSDQLSDNVLRGIRRSIEEGKVFNKSKHGYYRDRNFFLRPDGDNFNIMKLAWKYRMEGRTLEWISKFLVESGYMRSIGVDQHQDFKITPGRLFEVFADPTYTGIYKYGRTIVDLTQAYEFIPMVTVDEFLSINKADNIQGYIRAKERALRVKTKANFLRGRILCGFCGEAMTSGITPKKLKQTKVNYYYFRCDNIDCEFKGKSVRAKVPYNFIYDFIVKNSIATKEMYDNYVDEMKRLVKEKDQINQSILKSARKRLDSLNKSLEGSKKLLSEEVDPQLKEVFRNDVKNGIEDIKTLTSAIKKQEEDTKKNKNAIVSYEKFIELFKKIPLLLEESVSLERKDYIAQKVFLNLTVNRDKVLSYQLNEPFNGLIKRGKILSNGDGRS